MSILVLRSSAAQGGGGGTGDVDLSGLSSSATADTTAYTALDVPSMVAGDVFNDPVTGVRTVKLTSVNSPSANQLFPHYSAAGLSISQAWGDDGDMYTIAVIPASGSSYLIDYQLGGTTSNYRTFPGGETKFAFSRLPGQERICYITSSSQLRRYDTSTDSYADTGLFPYSWNTGFWFALNADETWAVALSTTSNTVTAIRLADGNIISQGSLTGLDEVYVGYGNVSFINRGATNSQLWDLDTNTLETYTRPNTNFGVVHVPSLRGLWMIFDSNTGGGSLKWSRVYPDATNSGSMNQQNGYWGQIHSSGHWWDQPAGDDQWWVVSNWSNNGAWTAALRYQILFINASNGNTKTLGHHYSDSPPSGGGTDSYRSQPHATISTDGKLVVFGSNMLSSTRVDAFLMEVPRS